MVFHQKVKTSWCASNKKLRSSTKSVTSRPVWRFLRQQLLLRIFIRKSTSLQSAGLIETITSFARTFCQSVGAENLPGQSRIKKAGGRNDHRLSGIVGIVEDGRQSLTDLRPLGAIYQKLCTFGLAENTKSFRSSWIETAQSIHRSELSLGATIDDSLGLQSKFFLGEANSRASERQHVSSSHLPSHRDWRGTRNYARSC